MSSARLPFYAIHHVHVDAYEYPRRRFLVRLGVRTLTNLLPHCACGKKLSHCVSKYSRIVLEENWTPS